MPNGDESWILRVGADGSELTTRQAGQTRAIRHIGGGFRFVKAMGVELAERGQVQVSINMTNFKKTPLHRVFECVRSEAARYGVSIVGSEIVGTIPGSEKLQKAIEHHHEAFDGTGYPAGLSGEQIPLWARIIAIADAYVNMTNERSFASAKSSEQALAELAKLSGTRYDGMLVRILVRELKSEKAPSNLGN